MESRGPGHTVSTYVPDVPDVRSH
eukprot:SAG22_NODE_17602_length_302_cov_0.714286_1_plen_23_part_10